MNKVGTQGIGSAAMIFARLFAIFCRLAYYVFTGEDLWIFTYADDLDVVTMGPRMIDNTVLLLLLLATLRVPFSWKKCEGGLCYSWLGLFQNWKSFQLGLSETRALWIARWCEQRLDADRVRPKELVEVLGRFSFATAAVDFIKPFLGPLYAWSSAAPEHANLRLPIMLRLIFRFLIRVFRDPSLYMIEVYQPAATPVMAYLGDAHASMDSVGIGGYQADKPQMEAAWFSLDLDSKSAPWAFQHGEETFRAIAALELFTTLLCVKLLPTPERKVNVRIQISVGTDNKGNSYALKRWATTKHPLGIILMELAVECRLRNISLDLLWVPRLQNCQADALSNGITHGFDPKHRIEPDLTEIKFHVLNDMMTAAQELYLDVDSRKKVRAKAELVSGPVSDAAKAKRSKTDRLRVKDIWDPK